MKRRTFIKSTSAGALVFMSPMTFMKTFANVQQSASLEDSFINPPDSARAKTWWHWMNGNVTREGITLDLEAMKQAGIGGFQIFDVGQGIAQGPVAYHSEAWHEMKSYAAREAERLGLGFEMHNCPGWSSSGGPWITPEMSMQYLVWSEAYISGGKRVRLQLPQPIKSHDYYRDAMVLAFPSLKGEEESMQDRILSARTNQGAVEKRFITDGDLSTGVDVEPSGYLQLELNEISEIRSVVIYGRPISRGNAALEVSEDGTTFEKACDITISSGGRRGGAIVPGIADFPSVKAKYFRLSSVDDSSFTVQDIHITSGRNAAWTNKTNLSLRGRGTDSNRFDSLIGIPSTAVIDPEKVIDISGYVDSNGALDWKAPEGDWTIIRFGHTPTGITNNAPPDMGSGLECDKFSREAYEFHWDHMLGKLLPSLQSLASKGMVGVLVDSYEVGAQNWSSDFPGLFKHYRGYNLLQYMPAMTGRIVGSITDSDRFLFDIRKTCADAVADNYYGYFTELCEKENIIAYTEPYDSGPFDEMQVGTRVDVPMGEFWIRGRSVDNDMRRMKLAASVAHVCDNGNQIVGAEAYTGRPNNSKWLECPYMMKAQGDWMYTIGLNQFIFHRYAFQPHPTAAPGMTMGQWGFHFDRTNTWFSKASGWLDYVAKTQNMLMQGRFVADIAFHTGEQYPNRNPLKRDLIFDLSAGYDYDTINTESIINSTRVEDGDIVLKNGMRYRILVLSGDDVMTLDLIAKIRDLVNQGAIIVSPKPVASPSLEAYMNNSDLDIVRIADEVWGEINGDTIIENRYGKGKVIWGLTLMEILNKEGIDPDFEYTSRNPDAAINFIHRKVDDAEVYFVANLRRNPEDLSCVFRVDGKVPEIWNTETGSIKTAAVYELAEGKVRMPLRLDFSGSVFVVFRAPASSQQLQSVAKDKVVIVSTDPYPVLPRGRYADVRSDFAVSLWVKPETDMEIREPGGAVSGYYAIFPPNGRSLYGAGHATCGISVGRNGIVASENSNGTPVASVVSEMPLSGWTHLSLVYRNNTPALYVDGELAASGEQSQNIVHPAIKEEYMDHGATFFEGDISALVLSATPLDEGTIKEKYDEGKPVPEDPPVLELNAGTTGNTSILCWQAGNYELKDNGRSTQIVDVEDLGVPTEIVGPWTIRFPSGSGAPSEITMDKLISLHRHSTDGVKYFSGTASYLNTFQVSEGTTGGSKRLYLDLGRVEVLAEVKLNGRNMGIFWKPPYRIDITDLVNTGENQLEVLVTNLWPNRLIGDEQLPPEYQYGMDRSGNIITDPDVTNVGIVDVPEWYITGKPKPAGQRIAFSVWKHYNQYSPLLESGLLGPVKIRQAYLIDL